MYKVNMETLTNKHKDILDLAYGIECGCGWQSILDSALDKLQSINQASNKDLRVVQIKQKFGQLRIYVRGTTYSDNVLAIETILHEALVASSKVCEKCGDPAKQIEAAGSLVYRTLCAECESEENLMVCFDRIGAKRY